MSNETSSVCRNCETVLTDSNWYASSRGKGGNGYICKSCISIRSHARYEEKKSIILQQVKAYHVKHKEKDNEYGRNWRKLHVGYMKAQNTVYRAENLQALRDYDLKRHRELKKMVISHYSEAMTCANPFGAHPEPFTYTWALSIDHINGGGAVHTKRVGYGIMFYKWLIKNGFPDGFQVLCMCCQHLKSLLYNERHGAINTNNYAEGKKKRWRLKMETLTHYSTNSWPQCADPYHTHVRPLTDIRILTLDHVNDDGSSQFKKQGYSIYSYMGLKRKGFPNDPPLQNLCWNCQWLKRAKKVGRDPLNKLTNPS